MSTLYFNTAHRHLKLRTEGRRSWVHELVNGLEGFGVGTTFTNVVCFLPNLLNMLLQTTVVSFSRPCGIKAPHITVAPARPTGGLVVA